MNSCKPSTARSSVILILLAALAVPATVAAQSVHLKVVYAEVPGIDKIREGNHAAAIRILEKRIKDGDGHYIANELSTLCALYVVKGQLSAATVACHDAVESDASYAAFNNRGVLRAHMGDVAGALSDFRRARVPPGDLQQYIEERMRTDARMVASSNFAAASEHTAKEWRGIRQSLAERVTGASIEDIND